MVSGEGCVRCHQGHREVSLRIVLYSSTVMDRPGGVQTVYRRLARGLRARGHTVHEVWADESADDDEWTGGVRLRLPERRSNVIASLRSALGAVRSSSRLAISLSRTRPDIVNVHFARPELLHFLMLRPIFRFRLVVSVHGSDLTGTTDAERQRLGRLLRRADGLTAVSAELSDLVTEAVGGRQDVVLVPNGIDTDFWCPDPAAYQSAHPPTCVNVGRLASDPKGQDVLLHAFASVAAQIPDARLVLVGEGPQRREFEELASRLGLGEAVVFTGNLAPEQMREVLRRADVFAMASRREGLPMALLESMAVGLPAVVTSVGSMADVVVDGTGSIVPPDDPRALAAALVRMLGDDDLRVACGRRARRRAGDFGASVVDEAYEALFERLVHRRGQ